jgi:hypothetical protein
MDKNKLREKVERVENNLETLTGIVKDLVETLKEPTPEPVKNGYRDIELPNWYGGEIISAYELSSARFDSIRERDNEIPNPKEGQLCRIYDAHGNWDNYLYTRGSWCTVSLPLLII